MSNKPETIIEESEESGDDDITDPKRGYHVSSSDIK